MIPQDIEQFLLRNIDSIAQWEALLLLRANSGKEMTVAAIARSIYIGEEDTDALLAQLTARGILAEGEGAYRYAPSSPDTERIVAQAADLYRRYLIPMTNIIHSKSRLRIQEFADAFKLRKDKDS